VHATLLRWLSLVGVLVVLTTGVVTALVVMPASNPVAAPPAPPAVAVVVPPPVATAASATGVDAVEQTPRTTAPAATPAPVPPSAVAGTDLDGLWARWQQLNDVCRGETGPDSDRACVDRAEVQERHARRSADEFLTAWRAGDATGMRRLSADDATDNVGRPLVPNLVAFIPAESRVELNYDVVGSGRVSAFMTTTGGGPALYLEWDMDYERGWVVASYAPDVG
jgi:hypothetical protein